MSSTYSVTLRSDYPLPPCFYQQVAFLGTPTRFKMFAEADGRIYEKHVFLAVHFKETLPSIAENVKPIDVLDNDDYPENLIKTYGEKLIVCGQFAKPIMYATTLTEEEKNRLVQYVNGVAQFPSVTDLTQTLYGLADEVIQEETLSKKQIRLLNVVRETFGRHFPALKK